MTAAGSDRTVRLGLIMADSSPVRDRLDESSPLAFGYFASFLLRRQPRCEVIFRYTVDELIAEKVDLIGISSSTEEFERAKEYAAEAKAKAGLPVLIGGPHITYVPGNLNDDMDVGVIGEGEITLRELIDCFVACGRSFPVEELRKIEGIVFREREGGLVETPRRAVIEDLDILPFPERKKLWIGHPTGRTFMFTSRGCPYHCSFCASTRFWPKLRAFTPEYVLCEIEHIVEDLGIHRVHLFDDLFVVPKKRFARISELVAARGFDKVVEFSAAVRANLINDEICEMMRAMNITLVMFGAESFSGKVLKYLKSGQIGPEDNFRAVDLLHKHGIETHLSMIYGTPVEEKEDLEVSLRAIERLLGEGKISLSDRGCLRPYPGTPVWDEAKKLGIVSEEMNWDRVRPSPGTPEWERMMGDGTVGKDDQAGRVRSFGSLYMGRIPENEFHEMILDHEERAVAAAPDNHQQWLTWGIGKSRLVRYLCRSHPDRIRPVVDFREDDCEAQVGEGWYYVEEANGIRYRWMGPNAVVHLRRSAERSAIRIVGWAPPQLLDARGLVLSVEAAGAPLGEHRLTDSLFDLEWDLPGDAGEGETVELIIRSSRSAVSPPDNREKSVQITSIGFAPAAERVG